MKFEVGGCNRRLCLGAWGEDYSLLAMIQALLYVSGRGSLAEKTMISFSRFCHSCLATAGLRVRSMLTCRLSQRQQCPTRLLLPSCILLRRLLASTQAKKASDWYVETLRSVWSEGEFWNNQTSVSGANAKRCAHAAASCDLFVKQRLPIHGDRLCHQSASEAGSPCITGIHWIHLSMLPCIDNLDRGFGCTSLRQQILLSAGVMAAKGTVKFLAARRMALQQIKNLKPF